MDVGIPDQFEDSRCLFLVVETDLEFLIDITESSDSAILSSRYLPPRLDDLRFPPSKFLIVVEFIIVPVFEGAVSVNA